LVSTQWHGLCVAFSSPAPDLGLQFLEDLAHDWTTTHAAVNQGNNDQWVPSKGPVTMAHLTRNDIPFHYALADAFTICDAYHCSLLGPTDPNRYYMWTGWVGNNGAGGGPVIDNAEAGYDWSTYPELLQNAGVSWKIYQDVGTGLTVAGEWGFTSDAYIGNYRDNSLLYFHQYQNALPGVLFLTFDENDGFFDHMVPPSAPPSRSQGLSTIDTTNEIFAGNSEFPAGPYGLGVRVPMTVISPWSKGGWVNSELFDHTSLIKFVEQCFGSRYAGLGENQITPWRRAVTGDLTSAFNFATPNDDKVQLPSTIAYLPPDNDRHVDYKPAPPAVQALPVQEPGVRPARAVPYELHVHATAEFSNGTVTIRFHNSGRAAAVFQVRSGNTETGPWNYTVGPYAEISDTWAITANSQTVYDLRSTVPTDFSARSKAVSRAPTRPILISEVFTTFMVTVLRWRSIIAVRKSIASASWTPIPSKRSPTI
jgi:phospholipase C